jgi:hypothetical protein
MGEKMCGNTFQATRKLTIEKIGWWMTDR